MRRVLAVALMAAAFAGMGPTAAFADSPNANSLPGQVPGPNSTRPAANEGVFGKGEYNFGHCQSDFAKDPEVRHLASDYNPAKYTAGDENPSSGAKCL